MPTTALQMVNRVLKKGRRNTVSALSDQLPATILDFVNEAAKEIWPLADWPWLIREGELVTVAATTGTSVLDTTTATQFTITGTASTTGLVGSGSDIISRIVVTSDGTYGNTSFRVTSAQTSGADTLVNPETSFPGTSTATASYLTFAAEYILGTTVQGLYEVTYEERPLTLKWRDELPSFVRGLPRPHDTRSTPEQVIVSGVGVATFDATGSAGDAGQRVIVYPVPDDEYVLRYRYRYRYPDLSATTDDFDGVPEEIIDEIVELAYSRANLSAAFDNTQIGVASRNTALGRLRQKAADASGDKMRRFVVPSLDRHRQSDHANFGRLPRNFGSIS